jgi:hypothetical protein
MLAFEQTVGSIRDLRLHGLANHLHDEHARAESPTRGYFTPYFRFYFLALNKSTSYGVQID